MQIGDEVIEAGPGDLVLKPRGVRHAFWNPGDEPARVLEIISPATGSRSTSPASRRSQPGTGSTWPDASRTGAPEGV